MGIDNREIHDPFTGGIRLMVGVTGPTVRCMVRLRRRRWVIVIVWGVGHGREHWVMHFGRYG